MSTRDVGNVRNLSRDVRFERMARDAVSRGEAQDGAGDRVSDTGGFRKERRRRMRRPAALKHACSFHSDERGCKAHENSEIAAFSAVTPKF